MISYDEFKEISFKLHNLNLMSHKKTLQCPPLNRITLAQHKSDNNNRMIQLTAVFCVLLRYNGTCNIWLQYSADAINRDPMKRRALYLKVYINECSTEHNKIKEIMNLWIWKLWEKKQSKKHVGMKKQFF